MSNADRHPCGTTRPDRPVVLAAAAHPDDIEFMMAGTLLLLKHAGAEIHMWNLANGHCGSVRHDRDDIIRIRAAEAAASAALADAILHPPLCDDLAIFYDAPTLARVAATVRAVRPDIILTHAPRDYMEDHQNTCRLIVTAAFGRGMRNFVTTPPQPVVESPVTLYHAMPHGLRDSLGEIPVPDCYINIAQTMDRKREMLAQHRSQGEWLDASQKMGAYREEMESLSRQMGRMSGCYDTAEAWRRHHHLGFTTDGANPLQDLLKGDCHVTPIE